MHYNTCVIYWRRNGGGGISGWVIRRMYKKNIQRTYWSIKRKSSTYTQVLKTTKIVIHKSGKKVTIRRLSVVIVVRVNRYYTYDVDGRKYYVQYPLLLHTYLSVYRSCSIMILYTLCVGKTLI